MTRKLPIGTLATLGLVTALTAALGTAPIAAQPPSVEDGFGPVEPGVSGRPAMLIETDYYVYGPGTGFTDPAVALTLKANDFSDPTTLYMYWHDRGSGQQLFYNTKLGFTPGEVDLFGDPGAPRRLVLPALTPRDGFRLFGPDSALGPLPAIIPGTTGRYQFVIEARDADGVQVISRANGLYNYVDGVVTHGGAINASETWDSDDLHFLESPVNVTDGTLTIEPGTVVLGSKAGQGTLVIESGARIDASGEALDPIIFSSELPVGDRGPGDWGGLVMNGFATTNQGTSPRPQGEGNSGPFGGDNDNSNSGNLEFARVEFAGIRFSEQNELNGIALQGVGRNTTINNIQVHFNQDDGVEFFGGTVDAKYILVTASNDDSLDWTFGWRGRLQHAVVIQCGGEEQDNGIEADNFEVDETAEPISNPEMRNLTFVGDLNSGAPPATDEGAIFRRGTKVSVDNALWTQFPNMGIVIDGDTSNSYLNGNGISLENTVLFDNAGGAANVDLGALGDPSADDPGFFNDPLGRPGCGVTPDVTFANSASSSSGSGFFDAAPYVGGVDPADPWIDDGWTTFSDN